MLKEKPPGRESAATWTSREAYLLAVVCLFAGLAAGYLFRGSASPAQAPADAPGFAGGVSVGRTTSASSSSLSFMAEPLLAALKLDPKNADTLVKLGNLYYDQRAYAEAIRYYERAVELRPGDVNVRTDLGTAYWYSGFPQKAVGEYEKALSVQPAYPQTLFNLGIVSLEGLEDPAAAIAAWEKLLQTNPQYPEKQQVLDLIAQAKTRQK